MHPQARPGTGQEPTTAAGSFPASRRADALDLVARAADVAVGTPGWCELDRYEDQASDAGAISDDLYHPRLAPTNASVKDAAQRGAPQVKPSLGQPNLAR